MPRGVLFFKLFQIPEYWSESADMIIHITWNFLVPSSFSPPSFFLFNSVWVVALHFASSAVEIAASNRL